MNSQFKQSVVELLTTEEIRRQPTTPSVVRVLPAQNKPIGAWPLHVHLPGCLAFPISTKKGFPIAQFSPQDVGPITMELDPHDIHAWEKCFRVWFDHLDEILERMTFRLFFRNIESSVISCLETIDSDDPDTVLEALGKCSIDADLHLHRRQVTLELESDILLSWIFSREELDAFRKDVQALAPKKPTSYQGFFGSSSLA